MKSAYERWASQRTANKIAYVLGAMLVGYEVNKTRRSRRSTVYGYLNHETGSFITGRLKHRTGKADQLAGLVKDDGEVNIETNNLAPRTLRRILRVLEKQSQQSKH